jgi:chromosome segregation ATPase
MRTREKSKAQLLREVKDLNEQVARLEDTAKQAMHRQDAAQEKTNTYVGRCLELEKRIETGHQEYVVMKDDRDAKSREVYDLKRELNEVRASLGVANNDLKFWKDRYNSMCDALNRMRGHLLNQAKLAGVLAHQVHEPVSYSNNERG